MVSLGDTIETEFKQALGSSDTLVIPLLPPNLLDVLPNEIEIHPGYLFSVAKTYVAQQIKEHKKQHPDEENLSCVIHVPAQLGRIIGDIHAFADQFDKTLLVTQNPLQQYEETIEDAATQLAANSILFGSNPVELGRVADDYLSQHSIVIATDKLPDYVKKALPRLPQRQTARRDRGHRKIFGNGSSFSR